MIPMLDHGGELVIVECGDELCDDLGRCEDLCGVQVFDTFVNVLEEVIILECRFQIIADVDSLVRPLGLVSVDDDVCARS